MKPFLLALTAAVFLAADDLTSGGASPSSSAQSAPKRYTRKSDGVIVMAMQATDKDIKTVPGVNIPPAGSPYVVTKTGMHESVYENDYVVTESDGVHYFTYPASKFEAEYELAPLETSDVSKDGPKGTEDIKPENVTTQLPSTLPDNTAYVASSDDPNAPLTPVGSTTGSAPVIVAADSAVPNAASVTGAAPKTVGLTAPANETTPTKETPGEAIYNSLRKRFGFEAEFKDLEGDFKDAYEKAAASAHEVFEKKAAPSPSAEAATAAASANPSLSAKADGGVTRTNGQNVADATIAGPGLHTPASPNAPTADEAKEALIDLIETFPKLASGIIEPAKYMRDATHLTAAVRAKVQSAIEVIENRYKFL
jgi:hypothetical protein